jgi:hypothetical protein
MENKVMSTQKERKIIYVDASFCKETNESKISLYDPELDQKNILTVSGPSSSTKAEQCAILYGCLYIRKIGLKDRKVYILNDNQAACNNSKIINLCKSLNIGISWIPREINMIADEGTKLDNNILKEESNILAMFYELIIDELVEKKCINNNDLKITKKDKDILKIAVNNSKNANKLYATIGQVGKYLKANYPNFKYTSLKKELLKYEKDFIIVDNNYVKTLK